LTVNNFQVNEILDVIDMDDKVIGQATRGEIHEKGLFHRAVHIFLFNSVGAMYIQRRSKRKDRYPLKLDSSAAGHVDSGETYEEAARRELQEELSIMADLTKILKVQPCPETDNESVVLFEAHSDAPPILDPEEICNGEFISPGDLSELMKNDCDDFVPAFILLWGLYIKTRPS
jgi:isopentenyldiphosphate isomerase